MDGGKSSYNPIAMQQTDPISVWTPHDVAEWLYMQAGSPRRPRFACPRRTQPFASALFQLGPPFILAPRSLVVQNTKDDHTHTFLVHGIDGPALLGLSREQMLEWKVKSIDATAILKGVEMLRRIQDGDIGWAPGADDHLNLIVPQPTAPTAPKPKGKGAPRKRQAAPVAPPASDVVDASADGGAGGDGGDGGDGAQAEAGAPAADGDWALTSVSMGAQQTTRKSRRGQSEAGDDAGMLGGPASPSYLKKMMSELHQSETGVPLWKEEMVERVKRAATARQMQLEKTMRDAEGAAAKSPRGGHLSSRRLGFGGVLAKHADDVGVLVVPGEL